MNIRSTFAVVLLGTAMLGACTTVVRTPAPPPRVVVREMPAPITEVIPAPPAAGFNWVPGHWVWRDNGWRWQAGHYVQVAVPPMPPVIRETITVAPSPAHVWIGGHWHWGNNGWVWASGRWAVL
jgi:WXXGXW repeat (2 copies)